MTLAGTEFLGGLILLYEGIGLLHFLLRNVHGVLFLVEGEGLGNVDFVDVVESLLEVNLVFVARKAVLGRIDLLALLERRFPRLFEFLQ